MTPCLQTVSSSWRIMGKHAASAYRSNRRTWAAGTFSTSSKVFGPICITSPCSCKPWKERSTVRWEEPSEAPGPSRGRLPTDMVPRLARSAALLRGHGLVPERHRHGNYLNRYTSYGRRQVCN